MNKKLIFAMVAAIILAGALFILRDKKKEDAKGGVTPDGGGVKEILQ